MYFNNMPQYVYNRYVVLAHMPATCVRMLYMQTINIIATHLNTLAHAPAPAHTHTQTHLHCGHHMHLQFESLKILNTRAVFVLLYFSIIIKRFIGLQQFVARVIQCTRTMP